MSGQDTTPPVPGARRLVTHAQVDSAVELIAGAIEPQVGRGNCVLLGVLLGGMFPLVQIASRLSGDFVIDACRASRYGASLTGGRLEWLCEPRVSLEGRAVIVIDDIYDEGHTLAALTRYCLAQGAASVSTVAFVRKRHRRAVAGPLPDHVGVDVPDCFVFGCGMDLYGRWRHLPDIWGLDQAA